MLFYAARVGAVLLCAAVAVSDRMPSPTGTRLQRVLDAAVGSGERSFVLPPGSVPLGTTVGEGVGVEDYERVHVEFYNHQ